MSPILVAILALSLTSIGIGAILAFTQMALAIKIDPLIEHLNTILPGINCGTCGFPGCNGYATAIVEQHSAIDRCTPGGQEVIARIAAALGKEKPLEQAKKVAFVYCSGGTNAHDTFSYTGVSSCSAAMQINGGFKQCTSACLGFGDCVAVCKFEAITLNDKKVAQVNPEKCVNCGLCYKACPKTIIRPVLHKRVCQVVCSNNDSGKIARSVCTVACIACGICVKTCLYKAIHLENNLAIIDPVLCTHCGLCVPKCPTKAIR